MTPIITRSELEHLNEPELHSKFCDIQASLSLPRSLEEVAEALASLENIRQAICCLKPRGPRP